MVVNPHRDYREHLNKIGVVYDLDDADGLIGVRFSCGDRVYWYPHEISLAMMENE